VHAELSPVLELPDQRQPAPRWIRHRVVSQRSCWGGSLGDSCLQQPLQPGTLGRAAAGPFRSRSSCPSGNRSPTAISDRRCRGRGGRSDSPSLSSVGNGAAAIIARIASTNSRSASGSGCGGGGRWIPVAAAVRSGLDFYRGRRRSRPSWSGRASRTSTNAGALDVERSEPRTIQPEPRPSMILPGTVLSDRFGLLGASGVLLAGLPPTLVATYLILRLIIPSSSSHWLPEALLPPNGSTWSAPTSSPTPSPHAARAGGISPNPNQRIDVTHDAPRATHLHDTTHPHRFSDNRSDLLHVRRRARCRWLR
jgi:hypothetical protein